MGDNKIYIFYSIFGALLFVLLYHFSLYENTIFCALIPALPILGLFGLFLIYEKKKDIKHYLRSLIIFFVLYVILFSIMYGIYDYTNNIVSSVLISLFIWLILTIYVISKE